MSGADWGLAFFMTWFVLDRLRGRVGGAFVAAVFFVVILVSLKVYP